MTADEEIELKKSYLSRSKRGTDPTFNLVVDSQKDDLVKEPSGDNSEFDDDDADFWDKVNSQWEGN